MNENQSSPVVAGLPDAKPQRIVSPSLPPANEVEGGSGPRISVVIIGRRVRLLDPDNFAGSVKYLVDQMRGLDLIPDDDPETIILATQQVKVCTFAEEGTEVLVKHL
jgi:hypothetical protein